MSRDADFIRMLESNFADRLQKNCLASANEFELLVIENDENQSCFSDAVPNGQWRFKDARKNNVVFSDDTDIVGLFINNVTRKNVWLLSGDQCFFDDDEPTRCDCLVFNDNTLCFVELKLNIGKTRKRADQMREAREQLKETIRFFKSHSSSDSPRMFRFVLKAYVVLKPSIAFPTFPKAKATRQAVFEKFRESTGVLLVEANYLEL